MKLLLLSYIFAFGNACSNVTDNTNVLERAFGPVITAKLEDTSEDIKASFQSGLTQQNGQLEESFKGILDETKEEFQQIINSKFEEQDEKIKGYIGQILQQFGQLFEQKEVLNQDCPEDWTRIEDSCYFISDEKLNITQAQDKCQDLAEDGKLFEPKNLRQNDLVYTLLKTTKGISSNDHYFIGINDRNEEGQYVYSSNDQVVDWLHWEARKNQPNNHGGNEDCVFYYHRNYSDGFWDDAHCEEQHRFICQKEL